MVKTEDYYGCYVLLFGLDFLERKKCKMFGNVLVWSMGLSIWFASVCCCKEFEGVSGIMKWNWLDISDSSFHPMCLSHLALFFRHI